MIFCTIFTLFKNKFMLSLKCKKYHSNWFWEEGEIYTSFNYVKNGKHYVLLPCRIYRIFLQIFVHQLVYHVRKLRKLSSCLCKKILLQKSFAKFHKALNLPCLVEA